MVKAVLGGWLGTHGKGALGKVAIGINLYEVCSVGYAPGHDH